ncbi:MAG: hypothetical protein AB3N20_02705 [Rhizobiaceae bacterium]
MARLLTADPRYACEAFEPQQQLYPIEIIEAFVAHLIPLEQEMPMLKEILIGSPSTIFHKRVAD